MADARDHFKKKKKLNKIKITMETDVHEKYLTKTSAQNQMIHGPILVPMPVVGETLNLLLSIKV